MKKNNLIVLIIFLLSSNIIGCATATVVEPELFQNNLVLGSRVDVSAIFKPKGPIVEAKDCINIYLFVPDKFNSDTKKILDNVCPPDKQMIQGKTTEEFWTIGIYSRMCHVTRAHCI